MDRCLASLELTPLRQFSGLLILYMLNVVYHQELHFLITDKNEYFFEQRNCIFLLLKQVWRRAVWGWYGMVASYCYPALKILIWSRFILNICLLCSRSRRVQVHGWNSSHRLHIPSQSGRRKGHKKVTLLFKKPSQKSPVMPLLTSC